MFIIVNNLNNKTIVQHGSFIYYVKIINDTYTECEEIEAIAILNEETKTVYPFPDFSVFEVEETDITDNYYQYVDGKIGVCKEAFSALKAQKLNELSEACQEIIFDGIDVETMNGLEHFSLTIEDQINILSLVDAMKNGATQAPYHADGESCRMFNSEEITKLSNATYLHKTYHTTYFNRLKSLVIRCDSVHEIQSVYYGVELPCDLDEDLVILTNLSSQNK